MKTPEHIKAIQNLSGLSVKRTISNAISRIEWDDVYRQFSAGEPPVVRVWDENKQCYMLYKGMTALAEPSRFKEAEGSISIQGKFIQFLSTEGFTEFYEITAESLVPIKNGLRKLAAFGLVEFSPALN